MRSYSFTIHNLQFTIIDNRAPLWLDVVASSEASMHTLFGAIARCCVILFARES
jgi:hypothetical protein